MAMRAILKAALLLSLVAASDFGLYSARPPRYAFRYLVATGQDYLSAIADKHRLAELTPPPRLLLAGGSSLAFSVDSATLESSLGLHVVNLAIHAGLGLSFVLRECEALARPGDRVVLSIEPDMSVEGLDELLERANEAWPSNDTGRVAAWGRRWRSSVRLAAFSVNHTQSVFRSAVRSRFGLATEEEPRPNDWMYRRSGFNAKGDFVGHLDLPPASTLVGRVRFGTSPADWQGALATRVEMLNGFARRLQRRGITVYLLYPNIDRSHFELNRVQIEEMARTYQRELVFDILNTPETFIADQQECFDTVYHLNRAAREEHTRSVALIVGARLRAGQ